MHASKEPALKMRQNRENWYLVSFFALGFCAGIMTAVVELNVIPKVFSPEDKSFQVLSGTMKNSRPSQSKLRRPVKTELLQNMTPSGNRSARILCWIMTTANNHQSKAVHVKTTWGKHCDMLLFMSDGEDKNLPAINVKVGIGREFLWAKTVKALQYVHEHHENDYDWAVKADDDTFMLIENVKKMVMSYNPAEKIYFGYQLKVRDEDSLNSYTSGGAGYITSRESVKTFVEFQKTGNFSETNCQNITHQGPEDYNLGFCFEHLDVKLVDSRDRKGRQTFLPMNHDFTIFPASGADGVNWWYYSRSYWPIRNTVKQTFSLRYISNHYVAPVVMHQVYYLVYNIKHPLPVEQVGRLMQNTSFLDMTRPPN